jgi:hypothetical protein
MVCSFHRPVDGLVPALAVLNEVVTLSPQSAAYFIIRGFMRGLHNKVRCTFKATHPMID